MEDLTTVPILTKSDCIIALCSSWGRKAYYPFDLLEKLYPYTSYHSDKEKARKSQNKSDLEIKLGSWYYYKDPSGKGPVTIVIVSSYKPGQSVEINKISIEQMTNGKISAEEREKIAQDTMEKRIGYIREGLESLKKIDAFKKLNVNRVFTFGWSDTQKSCFPSAETNVYTAFNDHFKGISIPWNMLISQRNSTDLKMVGEGLAPARNTNEAWCMKNDLLESFEEGFTKKNVKKNEEEDDLKKRKITKEDGKQAKKIKMGKKTKAEPVPSTSNTHHFNVNDIMTILSEIDITDIEYEVATS